MRIRHTGAADRGPPDPGPVRGCDIAGLSVKGMNRNESYHGCRMRMFGAVHRYCAWRGERNRQKPEASNNVKTIPATQAQAPPYGSFVLSPAAPELISSR